MTQRKDGGPAFPVRGVMYDGALGGQLAHGASLRDYFAAKAMQSICPNIEDDARVARMAYELADAMLAEREKGQ